MAITRRQSGKLPTPTRKSLEPRSELDSDDAEILSSESDLTELDDEDDEYLEGNARTSPSTTRRHIENDLSDHEAPQPLRQSKKQKTSKSVVGAAKSNGRRARLAVLPTMPLDILFEILGHLRPVDLLQVARASKVLRKILMSRSSKSVWNAARENVPGLPATPGDISDAQWAHLIFETDCHAPGCKKKGIRKIDWALRIRACERCLKENVVWSRRFAKRFPDLQPDIMQLLPHSNIGGWAHGHSSDSLFYWEPAIWDMSKELGEYQKNVALRKPGAKIALNEFTQAQEALAGEIVKYASVCQAWASSAVNQRQEELRDLSDKRVKEIKARFEVLGWSPSHLARLEWDPVACESKKLTERVWVNIRPKLEDVLQSDRKNRRIRQIQELIKEHIKTCTASQRAVLPNFQVLAATPTLRGIAIAEGFNDMTAQELEQCRLLLPDMVTEVIDEIKTRLLAKLPTIVNEPGETAEVSRLELATSALICSSCYSYRLNSQGRILYWPETCIHTYDPSIPHSYDPNLATIIHSVVCAVQLSPESATASQLDVHNARVLCMSCGTTKVSGRIGRYAHTWRGAIFHCMTMHQNGEATSWKLLSQQDAEKIKQREDDARRNSFNKNPRWACNHCGWGYPYSQPSETAIKHVTEMHDIPAPALGIDVLQDATTQHEPLSMIHASGEPLTTRDDKFWKCVHCPGKGRLFILLGVQSHIKAVHQIAQPVETTDFIKTNGSTII